jgi:hypothetical protein
VRFLLSLTSDGHRPIDFLLLAGVYNLLDLSAWEDGEHDEYDEQKRSRNMDVLLSCAKHTSTSLSQALALIMFQLWSENVTLCNLQSYNLKISISKCVSMRA